MSGNKEELINLWQSEQLNRKRLFDENESLRGKLAVLKAERDATQKRCDDAYRNVAALFTELVNISLLTRLQGEVDDYAEVTKSVAEIVAERDALREAAALARPIVDKFEERGWCSSCHQFSFTGHKSDCERQLALAALDAALEEKP